MERRARRLILIVLACLVAGAAGFVLWLVRGWFDAPAGNLDLWVPKDVDAVIRFDARGWQQSQTVQRLWHGPAGDRLRELDEVDDALCALEEADEELAKLPFGGGAPPTIASDFANDEVLVALRGEEILVLTRISDRARAISLLRHVGEDRRSKWGVRMEGDDFVLGGIGVSDLRFGVRRDVLVLANSKGLFGDAIRLSDNGGASIATRADYANDPTRRPMPEEAFVWAKGEFVRGLTGVAPFGDDVLRAACSRPVRFDLRHWEDLLMVSARVQATDQRPAELGRVDTIMPSHGERATIARGALPLTAAKAVRLLVESQPESRRRLLEDVVADGGGSLDGLVADLSRHFDAGVGFEIERLSETDALRLDDPAGDPVEPIPATIVYLPLTKGAAGAFVADLERHAKTIFGEDSRLLEEPSQAPTRIFRVDASSFGPEWKLLTPAFAVDPWRVVFSTNADALRRALARYGYNTEPSGFAALTIDVPMLKQRLLDLRWEAASRATYHDWAAERRAFRAELARAEPSLAPADRVVREEKEILRRVADRRDREFPAAIDRYRKSLAWLDQFMSFDLSAKRNGNALSVGASVIVQPR